MASETSTEEPIGVPEPAFKVRPEPYPLPVADHQLQPAESLRAAVQPEHTTIAAG